MGNVNSPRKCPRCGGSMIVNSNWQCEPHERGCTSCSYVESPVAAGIIHRPAQLNRNGLREPTHEKLTL